MAKKAASAKPSVGKPRHSNDERRRDGKGKGTGGLDNMRSAATVRRLEMYKTRPVRNSKGKILHEEYQSKALPNTRIQPDRRWFGNTRVVGQQELERFRTDMAAKVADAYTVVLKQRKLPLSLMAHKVQGNKRVHIVETEKFEDTFGPRATRKRPRLAGSLSDGYNALQAQAQAAQGAFGEKDAQSGGGATDGHVGREGEKEEEWEKGYDAPRHVMFEKGQSKRIWGELFKVLDSSDVVIQVLDARDPNGTRCGYLEKHVREKCPHKHILLLLNKCDLVPSWVAKAWLHRLSREFPTLAFHASVTNPFGKGALLSLLRQLSRLKSDKQAISVGFVGYPNVGKSSVINTLRTKKVCKVAPVPGETKVWQYITLTRRVFLIDCPGVVFHDNTNTDTDSVLKGVVRVAKLEDATEYVGAVLRQVKPKYLARAYGITEWESSLDFLTQMANRSGKLRKGGEPDLQTVAKMLLLDWQRGKIPFFKLPPDWTPDEAKVAKKEDSEKVAEVRQEGREVAKVEDRGVKRKEPPSGDVKMVADKKGEGKRMKREAGAGEKAGEGEGAGEDGEAVAARRVSAMLKAVSRKQQKEKLRVAADFFDEEDERGFEGISEEEDEVSEEEGEVEIESEDEEEGEMEDGQGLEGDGTEDVPTTLDASVDDKEEEDGVNEDKTDDQSKTQKSEQRGRSAVKHGGVSWEQLVGSTGAEDGDSKGGEDKQGISKGGEAGGRERPLNRKEKWLAMRSQEVEKKQARRRGWSGGKKAESEKKGLKALMGRKRGRGV